MKKYLKIALSTLALSATATGISVLSLTSCGNPDSKNRNSLTFGPNNEYKFYNQSYNFDVMPKPEEGKKVYFHLDKNNKHMTAPDSLYGVAPSTPFVPSPVSISLVDAGSDNYQCCLTYTEYCSSLVGTSITLSINIFSEPVGSGDVMLLFSI